MNEPEVLVGSAVATVPRDVALRPTADRWPVRHEEPGRTLLVERWRTIPPALLVREATGGLEVPVAGAVAEAGLPVVVVNPRHAALVRASFTPVRMEADPPEIPIPFGGEA
jgi:transposase